MAEYLRSIGPERAAVISGRLGLLRALDERGPFHDPPFQPVAGSPDLRQLLVDHDQEVHRVVFGARGDGWVLVHAFLDGGPRVRGQELIRAVAWWQSPTR